MVDKRQDRAERVLPLLFLFLDIGPGVVRRFGVCRLHEPKERFRRFSYRLGPGSPVVDATGRLLWIRAEQNLNEADTGIDLAEATADIAATYIVGAFPEDQQANAPCHDVVELRRGSDGTQNHTTGGLQDARICGSGTVQSLWMDRSRLQ